MNDFKEFIDIFESSFDCKYNGVYACMGNIAKIDSGIKIPSRQTIYNWIHAGKLSITDKDLLRKKYKGSSARRVAPAFRWNAMPIAIRDKSINERKNNNDFEIDLINSCKGFKKNVLTMVDRKTRFTFTRLTNDKRMSTINDAIRDIIETNNLKVNSITTDNGSEFCSLGLLCKEFNIKYYYCLPYCSCQRGSNEVWNALFRRSYPKRR